MSNLLLIYEQEENYSDKLVENFFDSIEIENKKLVETEEWKRNITNSVNLFGINEIIHLNLRNDKNRKQFVGYLKKNESEFKGTEWIGNGLVITVSNKVGTKSIEKLVKESSGKILDKGSSEERKTEILSELYVSEDIKNVLSYYVGNDYSLLLPVINSIRSRSVEEQANMTMDDVLPSVPKIPGSVDPWVFADPMLKGDTKTAIREIDRILNTTPAIVPFSIMANKVRQIIQCSVLRRSGIKSIDEQAKMLAVKNKWALKFIQKQAGSLTQKDAEQLTDLMNRAENDIKGGSTVDMRNYMKQLIVRVSDYFK